MVLVCWCHNANNDDESGICCLCDCVLSTTHLDCFIPLYTHSYLKHSHWVKWLNNPHPGRSVRKGNQYVLLHLTPILFLFHVVISQVLLPELTYYSACSTFISRYIFSLNVLIYDCVTQMWKKHQNTSDNEKYKHPLAFLRDVLCLRAYLYACRFRAIREDLLHLRTHTYTRTHIHKHIYTVIHVITTNNHWYISSLYHRCPTKAI